MKYLSNDQYQIDGITFIIIIKIGEKTTEILINNQETQEVKVDFSHFPTKKYTLNKTNRKKKIKQNISSQNWN